MDKQSNSKISVIITGVTGMAGEGVLNELGLAMINSVTNGYGKQILEVKRRSCLVKRIK